MQSIISKWMLAGLAAMLVLSVLPAWQLDSRQLFAQENDPFPRDSKKARKEMIDRLNKRAEENRKRAKQQHEELKKQIEQKKKNDPFKNDPFNDDPFNNDPFNDPNNQLTPEEEAAAQSAAGCLLCGVCGIYGAAILIPILVGVIGIAVQIFLTVYTYNDAVKHHIDNPGLWAVLVFFVGPLGFLIYYIAARNNNNNRPQYPQKPY